MSQILKLYKYYLKKLLKSWYFWVFLSLAWLVLIVGPIILHLMDKKYHLLGSTYKNSLGFMLKNFIRFFSNYKTYDPPIFSTIWKMFLSFWTTGIIATLFINSGISDLVGKPKEDGEDKTVLTVASPIKRNDVILAKTGAFFTFFWLSNFLGFFLPIFGSYCWTGGDQGIFSAKFAFAFVALFGLVFPLLLFLLIHSILFFTSLVMGTFFNWFFTFFLFMLPMAWQFAMGMINPSGGLYKFMDKTKELMLETPLFVIPLCLAVGGLFFYLYWNSFTKRDFN